ncbi:HdeD family acid-resistance protein [Granulicella arctica]|uniref:HdeD family acid-resistance protein n=1 Tax=Granulicella arctica TaxID=940613 RepID=UPI0021DF67F4|nr:DUF308 domain-containing protein [Granulicella arctica]
MFSDVLPTHRATNTKRFSAVFMVVVGVAAMFAPLATGIGVSILVGMVTILAGFAYAIFAFAARGSGTFLWRVLVSAAFTVAGLYLLTHPLLGIVTLTLLIAVIFLAEGIAELASYASLRFLPHSGILLVNAIFSLLLALLIWRNWPSSSAWAIGTLVGVNLITTGVTRLAFAPL